MTANNGYGEWVYRTSKPDAAGPHPVILLLHGWTGNENSMWVFTPRLPAKCLFIAPRGLYPAARGGYSWHIQLNTWPRMEHFQPAVDALMDLLTAKLFPEGDFSELQLVGFSQGAALAYTFTLLHPERVASLSALSGFLPEGATTVPSTTHVNGLPVFITHGTKDGLVPVERARQAAEAMDRVGAKVTYCEHDVGHKLSVNCFRGLETFHQGLG